MDDPASSSDGKRTPTPEQMEALGVIVNYSLSYGSKAPWCVARTDEEKALEPCVRRLAAEIRNELLDEKDAAFTPAVRAPLTPLNPVI
jgi:hypothetical protein